MIAKEPVPGRVKTRLCPPCTAVQAADIALAALQDTLDAVSATPAVRRVLLLDGDYPAPSGWTVVPQRGDGLGGRLANGFADSALPSVPTLLIGMDTPQVTPSDLLAILSGLDSGVLCPAADGGWWALALSDPWAARVLAEVPMSRPDTFELTMRAFGGHLSVGETLRDADTFDDALAVAEACPGSRFARAVAAGRLSAART